MTKIIKASGELVDFDETRLRESLRKAGTGTVLIERVVEKIKAELHEGMTTKEIYRKAYSYLKQWERASAARYSLKRAIMELGPSGYPFEDFVGRIIEYEGFNVQVGVILKGRCIQHEVDVYAEDKSRILLMECKYHGAHMRKSDVKTALYFHSRFNDLKESLKASNKDKDFQGFLVTNTRFTTDAADYGACSGLKMISWDQPKGESLKERIGRSGLHPITCMTTITKKEKRALIGEGIILTRDLSDQILILEKWGFSKHRRLKIADEATQLCDIWETT